MYDRVNRRALWKVLEIYRVGGKMLEEIKGLYEIAEAAVRVNGTVSE